MKYSMTLLPISLAYSVLVTCSGVAYTRNSWPFLRVSFVYSKSLTMKQVRYVDMRTLSLKCTKIPFSSSSCPWNQQSNILKVCRHTQHLIIYIDGNFVNINFKRICEKSVLEYGDLFILKTNKETICSLFVFKINKFMPDSQETEFHVVWWGFLSFFSFS